LDCLFFELVRERSTAVSRSVFEAIKQGDWTFEPSSQEPVNLRATAALPGTAEKLDVLKARAAKGEPLWHPHDRLTYGEETE
jgi:hypothetical protein